MEMTTKEMNSLQKTARIVAVLTLAMTAFAFFSMLDVPDLIVSQDVATSANERIVSGAPSRLAIVSDSMIFMIEIPLLVLLYVLVKPVNQTLSLIAALARLAMTTIQGINVLNRLLALQLLSGADYMNAFEPDQVQALAMLFLHAHESVVLIWGLFFALHLAVLGYLVLKSGYMPGVLGVVLMVVSLCYLVQDWGTILLPAYTETWALIGFLGILELAFPLWLLIKGVRDRQPATTVAG